MYPTDGGGGLFGDLPQQQNVATSKHFSANGSSNTSNCEDGSQAPADTSKAPSLVDTLGKAGTTMAFVPTSLKRKAACSGTVGFGAAAKKAASSNVVREGTGITGSATKGTASKLATSFEEKPIVCVDNVSLKVLTDKRKVVDEERKETAVHATDEDDEHEEMRALHASVTDPYDPMLPNDYLAHKERKKMEIKRAELEKAARERLKEQQIMREQIAEERRKIEATGDVDAIVESRARLSIAAVATGNQDATDGVATPVGMGRGRGRGRGVSNLPAWLIKKQEEQAKKAHTVGHSVDRNLRTCGSNLSDQPIGSRLVVLLNMVAPGEVDEDLSEEVREECEERCGSVASVDVKDADDTHPQVRVLVLFKKAENAKRASEAFHGRVFGGRTITAKLLDEMSAEVSV